mmetsp:Transcript_33766/g.46278  ORF Transcript_33766/g.46278 Transcript_33766/m.46278 type:complete len:110 (+) Transcript_33766:59-388(+)
MRSFGVGLLSYHIERNRTAEGISLRTLVLFGMASTFRLLSACTAMRQQDTTFLCYVEALSLAGALLAIYLILVPLKYTYDVKYDKFGIVFLVVPCFVVALFFPTFREQR